MSSPPSSTLPKRSFLIVVLPQVDFSDVTLVQVDSPWPLQIRDHAGQQHSILLKPGQMIWYESASLVHARSEPLNGRQGSADTSCHGPNYLNSLSFLEGTSYENMFVHFMPRAQPWYKTDWNIRFGRPDPLIR